MDYQDLIVERRGGAQSAHAGQYDGRGTIGLPMEELHACDAPRPVIRRHAE